MISPNIILPFDGNHADIPAGFSRDTRFDGKFPKGKDAGTGSTSGSDTHTHTAAHTHNIAAHTHSATSGGHENASWGHSANRNPDTADSHSHTSGYTGAATVGTTASATINLTSSTENSLPPYYEVIFIKSTGYNFIPVNGMIFSVSARSGLTFHTDSNGLFLRGAGTGDDAGGTGGNSSHTHAQTHTHSVNAHGHATGTMVGYSGHTVEGGTTDGQTVGQWHTHTFTVSNATQAINSNSTVSSSGANIPYNKTLGHYVATSKTLVEPGDIAMTTESAVPIGWLLCDGNNGTPDLDGFYIKNNATSNTVTGSNTHNHTVIHGHTGSGTHTHTQSEYTSYIISGFQSGTHHSDAVPHGTAIRDHRHKVNAPSSVTANYDSVTATATTENNEPAYIETKFIQFEFAVGGGALFAMA